MAAPSEATGIYFGGGKRRKVAANYLPARANPIDRALRFFGSRLEK